MSWSPSDLKLQVNFDSEKEPCRVRIYFTRCCWFNIYQYYVTQKVITVLWGTSKLLLPCHVSPCGLTAVCGMSPQRESWGSSSSAARRGETTSISSSVACGLLSPHQHGYACGLVPPHHTIMTVPGYVFFNVLSRSLPSDLLSAVKFVLWARIALLKQNSSTVEEMNGVDYCWIISITRFGHYTSCVWQDISSHPTLHYILVIYLVYIVLHYLYLHFQYDLLPMGAHRRVFGFEFIKVESSALILFFLCFVNTHPDTRDQQPHYNWA